MKALRKRWTLKALLYIKRKATLGPPNSGSKGTIPEWESKILRAGKCGQKKAILCDDCQGPNISLASILDPSQQKAQF